MVPTVGLAGPAGTAPITTLLDAVEVQPPALVTVNVYVAPAGIPLTVTDVVFPVVVTPPGILVIVHVPEGNPLNTTEPEGTGRLVV